MDRCLSFFPSERLLLVVDTEEAEMLVKQNVLCVLIIISHSGHYQTLVGSHRIDCFNRA